MTVHSTFAALLLAAGVAAAQAPLDNHTLAPYVPSPDPIVARMLELGELRRGELHYDLGSGDGRFVLTAAGRYHAKSVGYEIDAELVKSSRAAIVQAGLAELARIEQQDLYTADFTQVDLITAYLLPVMLEELRPILEARMKPGSRLVSHDYPIPGWTPDKTISGIDPANSLPFHIYLYRR